MFQHDANHIEISSIFYTHDLPSPEDFFIRKFNNDNTLTSEMLRQEESMVESKLFSFQEPENQYSMIKFTRIRDFSTLCRGGTLVGLTILYFKVYG